MPYEDLLNQVCDKEHMIDFKLDEFSLSFSFKSPDSLITDVANHLAQSKFQLKKLDEVEFKFKKIHELFPRISLRDDTQSVHIDLSTNKFEIDIRAPIITTPGDSKQLEHIFSRENLLQYNSDINYIIGALMSILHIQKFVVEVDLRLESEQLNFNFNNLLSRDITLTNKSKVLLNGIQIEILEETFNVLSKVTYRIWETMNQKSVGLVMYKQEMALPIQLDKMIYIIKDNFHNVLNQVLKQNE